MGPLAHAFLASRQEQEPCASKGSSHGFQGNRIIKAMSEQAKKKPAEEEKSDGESPLPKTPLNNETHEVIGDLVRQNGGACIVQRAVTWGVEH